MLSLTIWVYLHSFSCCCLPNLWNPAKFFTNSNLYQLFVHSILHVFSYTCYLATWLPISNKHSMKTIVQNSHTIATNSANQENVNNTFFLETLHHITLKYLQTGSSSELALTTASTQQTGSSSELALTTASTQQTQDSADLVWVLAFSLQALYKLSQCSNRYDSINANTKTITMIIIIISITQMSNVHVLYYQITL